MSHEASQEGGGSEVWGRHLGPEELAIYLDGSLGGARLSGVEAHLAECAACRDEAIQIGRLLERGNGDRQRWRLAHWAAPAAAAAAIAAVLLLNPRPEDVTRQEGPIFRADGPGAIAITAVSPMAPSRPSFDSVRFVWHRMESDVVYQLTLMDEEGAVLWKATAEDTTLALPTDVELRPTARYYWYVDALLEMARTATSGVQEFVTSP